jgi:hypothetical protein
MSKIKEDQRPLGAQHSWARTPGTFLAGQSYIDGVDATAVWVQPDADDRR